MGLKRKQKLQDWDSYLQLLGDFTTTADSNMSSLVQQEKTR